MLLTTNLAFFSSIFLKKILKKKADLVTSVKPRPRQNEY